MAVWDLNSNLDVFGMQTFLRGLIYVYIQYILWWHGYLTTGNRRVVPSCCAWWIRGTFPDPLGQYVGFMPRRLG
jgi:hypothetical protein